MKKMIAVAAISMTVGWGVAQSDFPKTKLEYHGHGFRVVRVRMEPHEKTGTHTDSVRYEIALTTAVLMSHYPDGTSKELHISQGTSAWSEPITHWAENIGSTPFEEIEIIPDDEPATK